MSEFLITLSINIERTMTIMGEEKRMVVESPSGRRDMLVNMNRRRRPPVNATKNSKIDTFRFFIERSGIPLCLAMVPITRSCSTPRMTTTCIESISTSSLSMLE